MLARIAASWIGRVLLPSALLVSACNGVTPAGTTNTAPNLSPVTTLAPPETTTPLPDPTLPALPPAGWCETYADPVSTGVVANEAITEASGIALSRQHPATIWVHNDSGGGPFVYAMNTAGDDVATFELDAPAFDWEDMAIGPGPDPAIDYLYLGDIGDNLHFRPAATVFRIPEPDPTSGGGLVAAVERFDLVYPTPGPDSEALLVDPLTGDILLVTKGAAGEAAEIYRGAAGELEDGATVALELVGTFQVDPGAYVTAGDIDPTGAAIAFRGYNEVWLWPRIDIGFTESFAATPCRAPSTAEVQGEAIAFAPGAYSYYTVSEGDSPDINFVATTAP